MQERSCSVWDWGSLVAQAEVGMQNSCLLRFPLLQVPPRASGNAVESYCPLQLKWEKLLKCFETCEWCKADLFDVILHRNSPQTLHILWVSRAAALGGRWEWDYFICPK